ncbi:TIGR01777 family oxidoreductase [Ochrovirga pacifica]|uniref:TIGR01777 family oxidoreductase n=1 Tax=Ochrovirga pacifica TaxID=1042376 RepID=UPI0002559833|nr:TIGR01777 family oxidoreductase [Ochrovirga pacifica]
MKVLITGGTGLIGKQLQKMLLDQQIEVVVLSRSKQKSTREGLRFSVWDVDNEIIDVATVCNVDHIIHLAGANIADKRWTDTQKKIIVESRVAGANLIYKTLENNPNTVKSFISASGSNYYGTKTTDNYYQEIDAAGDDFLAQVCVVWEQAALQFQNIGLRTVCIRTGVVFAGNHSALQKMSLPIKYGVGAPLGSGSQILPVIHLHDLCALYVQAVLDSNYFGAYNAVADNKTNTEVTKEIAKQLSKPLWLPNVPAFVLKLMFGEMADLLLKGSAINPQKLNSQGFRFKYPTLTSILKDVL